MNRDWEIFSYLSLGKYARCTRKIILDMFSKFVFHVKVYVDSNGGTARDVLYSSVTRKRAN